MCWFRGGYGVLNEAAGLPGGGWCRGDCIKCLKMEWGNDVR